MHQAALILLLGDQLTCNQSALKHAVPGRDIIVEAEVAAEPRFVKHNRLKRVGDSNTINALLPNVTSALQKSFT